MAVQTVPTGVLGGTPATSPSSPLFERARKRLTQRLSLAGLSKQPDSSAIRLPSSKAAEDKTSTPIAPLEATIDVPVAVLLPILPPEVLTAPAEELLAHPDAQAACGLPANIVMPMLPAGKIEFPLDYMLQLLPEGFAHPLEQLGDVSAHTVSLPLREIVTRIPPQLLSIRQDQRPIDNTVMSMDEPFSPEMLAAAQQAGRATAASEDPPTPETEEPREEEQPALEHEFSAEPELATDPELPPPTPAEELPPAEYAFNPEEAPTSIIPLSELPEPTPSPDLDDPEPASEMVASEEPDPIEAFGVSEAEAAASTEISGPGAEKQADEEADEFAFARSPAYLEMLAKLEAENVGTETHADEPADSSEPVEVSSDDAQEPSSTSSFSDALKAFGSSSTTPSEAAEDATEAAEAGEAEIDEASPAPESAPHKPTFTQALRAFAPPVPPPPSSIPFNIEDPATEQPGRHENPDAGEAMQAVQARISREFSAIPAVQDAPRVPDASLDRLSEILNIPHRRAMGINDVVGQIRSWPGISGCILSGKDGLPISAQVPDGKTKDSFSAVTPKLMAGVSAIFMDLGMEQPREFTLPGDPGISVFATHGLYLVLFHDIATLPAAYRRTILEVLDLLAANH